MRTAIPPLTSQSCLVRLLLKDIRGNFARDFRPDPPAWVKYTNNFLAVDQLLSACLQDNNSSSTVVGLLIWEVWLQVGEQFGGGGSPMDGNPGKLLMKE